MAIKKKYQQAPKEKKLFLIAIPIMLVGFLFMIPIMIGVGIIPFLILFLICDGTAIALVLTGMKEHKKWVAEGNPDYRYYDTETGREVDKDGNPITGQPAPQPKPQPQPAPQNSGVDQPEPEPVFENEEPKEEQPAPQPAPQKEPETIRGADLTIFGKLLPAAGLGLLSLAFLLRTIMFIRELVAYAKYGSSWESYVEYAIRILGPLVLLALCVVALVKFFVNKQTINQGYKAMLKVAIWYAVLNIVGLVYILTCAGLLTYDMISLMIRDSNNWNIYLEMLIKSIIIDLLYIAFAIALIVFVKIADKTKVDSVKNKVFAILPFGIIVLTEILFMIITGATLPEGFVAPGYFVTAVIILLGAGSLGAIPFLVKFEKEDAAVAASAPVAAAPVAAASAEPAYQEPKYEEPKAEPQPQKKNDDNGPEVKSNTKKGLIIILIIVACLVLIGGGVTAAIILANKKNSGNNGPHDDDSAYVVPSSSSSSRSSSKSSSSSSRSSSSKSSSSQSSTYTPEGIIRQIVTNLGYTPKNMSSYPENYNYWLGDDGYYYTAFNLAVDDPSEAYLYDAIVTGEDFVPSYMVAIDDIYYGQWSEGLNGYFHNYQTQDGRVKLEMGSYFYNNKVTCQYATIYS